MGGDICLYLAVYAYMADITTPQERTRRLAILESFIPLGLLLSIPGGTYLKTEYGFVVVFSVSLASSLLALLYTWACVQESRQRSDYQSVAVGDVADASAKTEAVTVNDQKLCSCIGIQDIFLSALRTLVKRRPQGGRTLILALVVIFSICHMIELGEMSLWYMFFRLQYKMTDTFYSYLDTYFVILWFFSQLLLIPFLSSRLQVRDTSIMMVGAILNITGGLIIMLGREIWMVFLSYTAYIFYCNMTALCRNMLGPSYCVKL